MLGITFTPIMKWWEEWQLRIFLLGSLFSQFILLFSFILRQLPWSWCRWIVRLAYISSDAIAISALTTLSIRQMLHKMDEEVKGSALEVVWVPFLLVHLGGQTNISAYSLEDNEQWRWHVWTLVTKVAIAMSVFCKWVRASFASLQRFQSYSYQSSLSQRKQGTLAAWWTWCISECVKYDEAWKDERELEECELLQEYVQKASEALQNPEAAADVQEKWWKSISSAAAQTNYLVDVIVPYSVRIADLRSFMKLATLGRHYQFMNWYSEAKFSLMYSNMRTVASPLGFLLHFILFPCLGIASVVLFVYSPKDGYSEKDIRVTYVLFYCTAALEFSTYFRLMFSLFHIYFPGFLITCLGGTGWVFQYNLLSYYARKKKPTFLMKLAYFNFLRELVNKSWYIGRLQLVRIIFDQVLHYVLNGWKHYINDDAARYKRFNNSRGQLALNLLGKMSDFGWSLSVRFDESVLLWHIATDLCFHWPDQSPEILASTQLARYISNYMIYLLFIQPELLIPGARSTLFSSAIDDIESLLLGSSKETFDEEGSIAQAIRKATKTERRTSTNVHQACMLAEVLMNLDEKERLNVIHSVWVEMLCYSISRRSGYMIAKSMGEGTDSLQSIWLLWAFMGMETWVDRHHRLERSKEDRAAGVGGGEGEYCAGESSSSGTHTTTYQAGH
ncbi:hypothetical protein PR202_ga06278 [Eleusine coracana subsp. coracana]|uniref:DUF4220 domain-containing protein n=1 Tax=Eleusine coracana subsp. coracana TaxID=191504 RepID=A0AAV5BY18_ELECO|nr:hypothetical protein PR202_ga06278 [Eleusine coracana subsp. coracana]